MKTRFWLFAVIAVSVAAAQTNDIFVVKDEQFRQIFSANSKLEHLKDGIEFAEGPLWIPQDKTGYLLFSDIPANVIRKWSPDGTVAVFLEKSGYTGKEDPDAAGIGMPISNGKHDVTLIGSNGITRDSQGRIVFCTHGDHAIIRIEKDGKRTVLADSYEGKRLNSPNDLVYKSDGALYFTDHVAGLRGGITDPKRALGYQAVYLLKGGKLQAISKDLALPNGIAFSPDEKYLYIGGRNLENESKVMRFEVNADDTLGKGTVWVDMSKDKSAGTADGMKVDRAGNLYTTGPGGIWIISPAGKHLGTLLVPETPANLAFGGPDGKTLFIAARTGLYRIHTNNAGAGLH